MLDKKQREYDLKFNAREATKLLKRWNKTHSHSAFLGVFGYFLNLIRQMIARFAHIQIRKDPEVMDELCSICTIRVLRDVIPRLDVMRPNKIRSYVAKSIYAEIMGYLKERARWAKMVNIYDIPDIEVDDILSDDQDVTMVAEQVSRVLSILSKREQKILSLHYGLDGKIHTHKEIGRKFHISAERVRMIEKEALQWIRTAEETRDIGE